MSSLFCLVCFHFCGSNLPSWLDANSPGFWPDEPFQFTRYSLLPRCSGNELTFKDILHLAFFYRQKSSSISLSLNTLTFMYTLCSVLFCTRIDWKFWPHRCQISYRCSQSISTKLHVTHNSHIAYLEDHVTLLSLLPS